MGVKEAKPKRSNPVDSTTWLSEPELGLEMETNRDIPAKRIQERDSRARCKIRREDREGDREKMGREM